jgi:hypothetical protein
LSQAETREIVAELKVIIMERARLPVWLHVQVFTPFTRGALNFNPHPTPPHPTQPTPNELEDNLLIIS